MASVEEAFRVDETATDRSVQFKDQVVRGLRDVDKLILALPATLRASKVATLRRGAENLEKLSSVLMLTIMLRRPLSEVLKASDDLAKAVRVVVQLASKSRLSLNAQLLMRLLFDQSRQLHLDIVQALQAAS